MMHQPMRPIEVGIMNKECDRKGSPEPPHRVVMNMRVVLRVLTEGRKEHRCRKRREDENRDHRIPHLPPIVTTLREPLTESFCEQHVDAAAHTRQPRKWVPV